MSGLSIATIRKLHRKAAQIVVLDPRALPVFERMERELRAAEARQRLAKERDPVAMARALLQVERLDA